MADERNEKLLGLADGVRSFFEVTNVSEGRGWSAAFKAVRANDYMADSFLAELRALLDFIEVEFDPRFGNLPKPTKKGVEPATAPMTASRAALSKAPPIHGMETKILPDRGGKTPVAELKRPPSPPPKKGEPAKAAPPKPAPAPPRPAPAAAVKPAVVARKVAPPPPPPPRRGFIDERTSVSAPPSFGMDEPTGRTFVPPIHDPPKKRR